MISFREYAQLRESSFLEKPGVEDMAPKDSVDGSDVCLNKVADMAWHRYQDETRTFFQGLAEKDPDIREALSDLEGRGPSQADRVDDKPGDDKDVIAPPEADTSTGAEEGGM